MSQDQSFSIRTTQRVPRSCTSCSSRKVRCDKSIPCGTCIRRGQPDTCVREMVIVRGEVKTYCDTPDKPTYEELRNENERLRHEIEVIKGQATSHQSSSASSEKYSGSVHQNSDRPPRKQWIDQDVDGLERKLWDRFAANLPATKTVVTSWGDIIVPNHSCNDLLINYDEKWNSWVHYALEYPRFRYECESFMATIASGNSLEQGDASWMAVYFSMLSAAILMMDDDEAEKLPLPDSLEPHVLSQNWYNTAIFCLHRADFMRIPSIRSVQTIAILGICFNNFGDSDLGQHMWSCALRIAQTIGLDTPHSELAGQYLSDEAQHRLWWTLIICEWLSLPYHPPAIEETDFEVPYPTGPHSSAISVAGSEGENSVNEHPVHYHIFMARTATVFYRFLKTVRQGLNTLEEKIEAVRAADEELAGIIDTLPIHLQPDAVLGNEEEQLRNVRGNESWIVWQRFDLTLVLLHLRIRVNRTLQDQWLSRSSRYQPDWARTISVRSAVSIVWINSNWSQPASMRKQWALSYHIFIAAILLLREVKDGGGGYEHDHCEVIRTALDLLDQVKSRNALANHALSLLREQFDSIKIA